MQYTSSKTYDLLITNHVSHHTENSIIIRVRYLMQVKSVALPRKILSALYIAITKRGDYFNH